jgi:translation initiation factor IF-2
MSENKEQRLSKVAKEFSVSVSTITDFLKGKGHVIENNPMAKISEDLYSLLSKEYQSDKAAKEEAKQVTSTTRAKKENIAVTEEVKKPETKRFEEEEDILIKNVQPTVAPVEKPKEVAVEAVVKKEEPVKTKAADVIVPEKEVIKSDVKFTVVDKIDLDAINSKTKPAKKTKAAKEEEKIEKTPVTKGKGKAKKEEEPVEEIVVEIPVIVVVAPEIVVEAKTEQPVEDFYETKVEKLEGPKIMGKIDLPVKEERKKPVASSSAAAANDNKKKRKRIKKNFGGATLGDTWAPRDPNAPSTAGTPRTPGTPYTPRPAGAAGAPGSGSGVGRPKFDNKSPRTKYARPLKVELTPDQIQAQIKETLARLSGAGKSKASKHRKSKRDIVSERIQDAADQQEAEKKIIKVTEFR